RQTTDPVALEAMVTLQNRVKALALVHQDLSFSVALGEIDFSKYVRELAARLVQSYAINPESIALHLDVDAILQLDEAMPCALIINELISNTLKHAFPDKGRGDVWISLHQNEDNLQIEFRDNGIGLPSGFSLETTNSLGLQIVSDLTAQLRGSLSCS